MINKQQKSQYVKISSNIKKYTFWKYANLYFQSADYIEFAQKTKKILYIFQFLVKSLLTNA